MQSRRIIPIAWLAIAAPLLVQACGGQTGQDSNTTGGSYYAGSGGAPVVPPPNNSTWAGGTSPVWTALLSSSGAAWTVPGSTGPTTGPIHTGGWINAGGTYMYTGGTRAGGNNSGGFCSSTNCGAVTTTGVTSFGGTVSAGGTHFTGGTHAGGTWSGGATFGGTFAAGGTTAVGTDPYASNTCLLPRSSSSCDAGFTMYYFNVKTGSCETFIYGGCGGNANIFDTLQACQARCSIAVSCPSAKPRTDVALQCPLSAVCYYGPGLFGGCVMHGGILTCTDTGYGDGGNSIDIDTDASVPATVVDGGGPRFWACGCGNSGWSCTPYE